jgi:Uma2 family endonuclease
VSTITKRLTVDQYDQMVENGILPETNRFEPIEGRIVEKDVKNPVHAAAAECTRRSIDQALPAGWHTRGEQPVRIPNRRSEPEPDVSVVRGAIRDYTTRHPGPEDVALVVEVTRSSVAKDRALARVHGRGGIPLYWIVNVPRRRLEVYAHPVPGALTGGAYPTPKILGETESVELVIRGQVVGQIAVADLLP